MEILNQIAQATIQSTPPTVSNWTIVASLAAVLSAFSAFFSRRYAKRSYKLAVKIFNDRQANFKLYQVDSFRLRINNEKTNVLLFHIEITNISDSKSSFKASLHIHYTSLNANSFIVTLDHDENNLDIKLTKNYSLFPNDIRIDERAIQSKWVAFKQPDVLTKDYKIDKYSLHIVDVFNNRSVLESFIITERNHEL